MKSSSHKPDLLANRFLQAVSELPPLPKVIHYEDDYDEKVRSVRVADSMDTLTLYVSGDEKRLHFARFDERVRPLIRAYLLLSLNEMETISICGYFQRLSGLSAEDVMESASSPPIELKRTWPALVSKYSSETLIGLKGLLSFLCEVRFAAWTPHYAEFVSRALPVKQRDPYATVRSGDAFITLDEEVNLVRWLDNSALHAKTMDKPTIELACLVVCSYQFGMRPKQLGLVRKRDCSVRISSEDGSGIVHLTFRMIKQLDSELVDVPLHRKVKREWAPLFQRLMDHKMSDAKDTFLFGFSSRSALSAALNMKLSGIVMSGSGRVAYDLRHSMAQRLVDSGASHEELAAALGHSQLASGLVYFRQSANQAERVNKALGISSMYQRVAKIAAARFISPNELKLLKSDQQIAGVPHGIPIAGIGECRGGQPSCPYNPVTACYGCEKFIPVADISLHERVLEDFRGIVHVYKDVGRDEVESPAYLQLRRTIHEVQGVILDLQNPDGEQE